MKKWLHPSIKIVEPICEKGVPEEYKDYFALSLCKSIVMCAKYSTFAITASMIGKKNILSYNRDETTANRYKALFDYDDNFDDVKIRQHFENDDPDSSNLVTLKFKKVKKQLGKIYTKLFRQS